MWRNVNLQLEASENRVRNFVLENPWLTSRSWQTMVCHLVLYKLVAKNSFYFLNGWKKNEKKKSILWLRKIVWNSHFDIYTLSLFGTWEGQLSYCRSRVEYLWQRQYVACPKYLLSGPLEGKFAALCTRGSMNLGWVDELGVLCVPWNHTQYVRAFLDVLFNERVKAFHQTLKRVRDPLKIKNHWIWKFLT